MSSGFPDDPMALVEILITVSDSHAGDLRTVASHLQTMGLDTMQLQPALGAITGRAPLSLLDSLRSVEGVDAVEVARRNRAL